MIKREPKLGQSSIYNINVLNQCDEMLLHALKLMLKLINKVLVGCWCDWSISLPHPHLESPILDLLQNVQLCVPIQGDMGGSFVSSLKKKPIAIQNFLTDFSWNVEIQMNEENLPIKDTFKEPSEEKPLSKLKKGNVYSDDVGNPSKYIFPIYKVT